MIKSGSSISASISREHPQPLSQSPSTVHHQSDHEKLYRSRKQSRVSAAGSAMSPHEVGAQSPTKKSETSTKPPSQPLSSDQLSPDDKPVHSGELSGVRATPSRRAASKRSSGFEENEEEEKERNEVAVEEDAKRSKASDGPRILPFEYENCSISDLVQVICEMLMDLIRINDPLPLQDGGLTRFHSRVPPAISVLDYLHRLAQHATLGAPILLSMVYYIDKLCALYPAFTISSLTVHRFLIASATVASKGLSDAFWTNGTYARVGGVSIRELALLELELLWRIDWRIVPQPELLTDYYRSLVTRSEGFKLDRPARSALTQASAADRPQEQPAEAVPEPAANSTGSPAQS